jgi:hypothetical protein
VPWFRRLVAGLSLRSSGFHSWPIGVGFVVNKVELKQGFLRIPRFSLVNIMHQRSILTFVYTLLLPNGQMGKAWRPSESNILSEIGQHWVNKYLRCRLYRVHKTTQTSFKLRHWIFMSYSCIIYAVSCSLSSYIAHTHSTVTDDPAAWLNRNPFRIQQFPHRDSKECD